MISKKELEDLNFFKGKRVLITGHSGFKGGWLTYILSLLGAEILGFSKDVYKEHGLLSFMHHKNNIFSVKGDIRDISSLENEFKKFQPEIVFHLAAQALVKDSYEDPVETFETNVLGGVNLLEVIRNSSCIKSLVFITSDKCYENVEWVWSYRENDKLGGYDPYSASKSSAEIIFSSYYRSFLKGQGIGAATTRAGNVIGGGDFSPNRIIPDCARAAKSNTSINLRNPNSTRPWQHVLDPIYGYLKLAKSLFNSPDIYSGSWNFGPNTSKVRSVQDVASKMVEILQRGFIEIDNSFTSHHEANLLQLNCDKAYSLLNWKPVWDVDQSIEKTAEWYTSWLNNENIDTITYKQIKIFLGMDK